MATRWQALVPPSEPNSAGWLFRRGRRKLLRLPSVERRDDLGYPVFRAIDARRACPRLVQRFSPDLVVANVAREGSAKIHAARRSSASSGLPSVAWLRDVEGIELFDSDQPRLPVCWRTPNTWPRTRCRRGLDVVVVPSVVDLDAYRTTTTRRRVLFINPVAAKGVDRGWILAEDRPDIPFTFRRGWPLSAVDDAAASCDVWLYSANVELLPACRLPRELLR